MADRLDVAERLAEGRGAVENTQTYVSACHAIGYQHPGLTAHPSQIRDWYDSEDGLDLRALDRDCAALRAAGAAVAEALRMQRAQLAELAAAWIGPGGDSAVRFLERHCDAASAVAAEVRAAAQRCESLRDNLWYLVDSKVATAIAIDEGTRAQRPAWLAAAATVTTGTGDRAGAEEVVRQQITPYVDNEIRDDWLTTMRSTVEGVDTSYTMVIDRMAAAPPARFEVPLDLGPGYPPLPASPPPAVVAPAAIPPPPDLGAASALPAGDLGGLGGTGGGGGLGGLASRIVDAMGSLLGSAADQAGTDDVFDREEDQGEPEEAKDVDKKRDSEAAEPAEEAAPVDEPAPVDTPAPVDMPEPVDAPPPVDPPPVDGPPVPVDAPAPPSPGSTPCEIAADQLPQAGQ